MTELLLTSYLLTDLTGGWDIVIGSFCLGAIGDAKRSRRPGSSFPIGCTTGSIEAIHNHTPGRGMISPTSLPKNSPVGSLYLEWKRLGAQNLGVAEGCYTARR